MRANPLIAERLPATLELTLLAALIALAFGIPMGVYSALKRGTFASQAMMTISLIGVSLPTFLIGIVLSIRVAVCDPSPRRRFRSLASASRRLHLPWALSSTKATNSFSVAPGGW